MVSSCVCIDSHRCGRCVFAGIIAQCDAVYCCVQFRRLLQWTSMQMLATALCMPNCRALPALLHAHSLQQGVAAASTAAAAAAAARGCLPHKIGTISTTRHSLHTSLLLLRTPPLALKSGLSASPDWQGRHVLSLLNCGL
jgi:hypothetical protein